MSKNCDDQNGLFECSADYVVVGAGAGGTVVASRLAEAGYSVILLEAGPDTSLASTDPLVQLDKPDIAVPLNFANLWHRFSQKAGSDQCGSWHATQPLMMFASTNQNGVYFPYPRGCGAGGSVSHHAMQDGIGSLQVYDNISKKVKDNYWKGTNIKRLFKKMENVSYTDSSDPDCGTTGWLAIEHTTKDQLLVDVAARIVSVTNVPFRDNFCNPQLNYGVGNADVQVNQAIPPAPFGVRSYAYQDLLVPINARSNLIKVMFNSLVSKVILEKNEKCKSKHSNKYRATGVMAYNKAYLQEFGMGRAHEIIPDPDNSGQCLAVNANNDLPTPQKYMAKKEVIVCGGAIQTPQLLMLSGIGPKSHLRSVGIETKVNLPGVGSDLMDHNEIAQVYVVDANKYLPSWQALVLNSLYYNDYYAPGKPFETYYNTMIAPAIAANPNSLDSNTASIQWDWWSSGSKENVCGEKYPFPDVHCVPYETYLLNLDTTGSLAGLNYPGSYFNFDRESLRPNPANPFDQNGLSDKFDVINAQFAPAPEAGLKVYLSFLTENLKPKVTNGTIRLQSSDPRNAPIIEEQLYEDESGLRRMAKMVLQVRNIMNDPALIAKYGAVEFQPGPVAATEDDIVNYIKLWSAYGHHMCGTCQMGSVCKCHGKPDHKNTVTDSKCRVIGVDNLRIADTSVYVRPWLHAFNTSRAGYVVGEAVSEFIINKL